MLIKWVSPVARVAEVARRHAISTGLIYDWRREVFAGHGKPRVLDLPTPSLAEAFVTVTVTEPAAAMVVIDLASLKRSISVARGSCCRYEHAVMTLPDARFGSYVCPCRPGTRHSLDRRYNLKADVRSGAADRLAVARAWKA